MTLLFCNLFIWSSFLSHVYFYLHSQNVTCVHWMCLAIRSRLSWKSVICVRTSHSPPLTDEYLPAFYQQRTVTRTAVDAVQLGSQISGLGGLHCSELCTYSSDNCGGLRSVGARLTGLCGSQSEAGWVYKKPVPSVISENGLSRQSN